jgi:hypothetical protein
LPLTSPCHFCSRLPSSRRRHLSAGSGSTIKLARNQAAHYSKPLFIANLGSAELGDRAAAWLGAQRATFGDGVALAVGGPRESEVPGSYTRAVAFIGALLESLRS